MRIFDTGIAPELLPLAADLFFEYAGSLPFSLEYQGFSDELASLPGKYAAPAGAILLAMDGERALGCIAIRPHAGDECEIKRFYVRPAARGCGIGHRLLSAAVVRARDIGYASICLDSSADMLAARRTYEAAGFKTCERYNDDPDPTTVYFRLRLGTH
ncbi:MAG: GNAT family N-acetyltransferase [Phycisphaerales bacterium]|jgi:putative acetyltransferase|nr:GNAT family N-acetyltransferase [Phycisphaerales bacterium]